MAVLERALGSPGGGGNFDSPSRPVAPAPLIPRLRTVSRPLFWRVWCSRTSVALLSLSQFLFFFHRLGSITLRALEAVIRSESHAPFSLAV